LRFRLARAKDALKCRFIFILPRHVLCCSRARIPDFSGGSVTLYASFIQSSYAAGKDAGDDLLRVRRVKASRVYVKWVNTSDVEGRPQIWGLMTFKRRRKKKKGVWGKSGNSPGSDILFQKGGCCGLTSCWWILPGRVALPCLLLLPGIFKNQKTLHLWSIWLVISGQGCFWGWHGSELIIKALE